MNESRPRSWSRPAVGLTLLAVAACGLTAAAHTRPREQPAATLQVGQNAPDFSLMALNGRPVRLSDELRDGPVVLVLLRGWPGYQCPFCTRQFADFLKHASELASQGARVLFVYPGPTDGVKEHAQAFTANRRMPPNFLVLIDPDYAFTLAYGLRWNAPEETAYPATFVLDSKGTVRFVRVSREHGDRVPAVETLEVLAAMGHAPGQRQPSTGRQR
jgi:peroxiredoxin Q/BCP